MEDSTRSAEPHEQNTAASEFTSLKRPIYPMPEFVLHALEERGLVNAYRNRPPYQQNDYIGWITRAKQKATQEKRLAQMLDELTDGSSYMNMAWGPRRAPGR